MELKGTYTAMITPFLGDQVNYEGLRQNIRYQLENDIDGILVLGTTGETPTLSSEEQENIIKISREEINGKAPLMVGTGTNSTLKTIENTRRAKDLGGDIALIVTPYYNKPTDEGIFQHFKLITESVDIPIVVYNIQGRTSKNIETTTLKRIAEIDNIIGVKEASGNVNQMGDVINLIARKRSNFNVLSGDDSLTLPLISLGGKGVISVVSNLIPKLVSQMVRFALDFNFKSAMNLHHELLPLFKGAFIETNPIPIKEAMNIFGMPAGNVRLPLCEMNNENKNKLKNLLRELKLN